MITEAERSQNQVSAGGQGMFTIRKSWTSLVRSNLVDWKNNDCPLQRNPLTTAIFHYSSCEGCNEAEDHYKNLFDATTSIPRYNVLFTIGDFYACIGTNVSSTHIIEILVFKYTTPNKITWRYPTHSSERRQVTLDVYVKLYICKNSRGLHLD